MSPRENELYYGRIFGPGVASPTGSTSPALKGPCIVRASSPHAPHQKWLFLALALYRSRGRLRTVGALYRRVLGTHGRPVMGTDWWGPEGGRIVREPATVVDIPPWHGCLSDIA